MSPRRWWEELVYDTFITAGVSKQDLDPNFAKLFNSLYIRFSSDVGYAAFPDAIDTLQQLKRQRIKTGVISNSDERLHDVLKNLKMTEHLDFVLPSYRCGYEKPAHEIFDVALRNVRPPVCAKEALHVGDDLHADYRGTYVFVWELDVTHESK
ncbi:HAD-like domain-containing protein [Fennellomyces sp. T-0311]|nr:HAD-like domain-containing protein [Fennellomyces sp. T-0311]